MITVKNFSTMGVRTEADEREIVDNSIGKPTVDGDTFRFFKVRHNERNSYPVATKGYQDTEIHFYDEKVDIVHKEAGRGSLKYKANKMRERIALCSHTPHNIDVLVKSYRARADKKRGHTILDPDVNKEVERKYKIWWETLSEKEKEVIKETEAFNGQTPADMPARWGSKTTDEMGANALTKQIQELQEKLEAAEKKNVSLETEKSEIVQENIAEKEVPKSDVPVEWIRMKPFSLYKVCDEKNVPFERWCKKDQLISLLMSDDPKTLLAKYRLERANNDDTGNDGVSQEESNELDTGRVTA